MRELFILLAALAAIAAGSCVRATYQGWFVLKGREALSRSQDGLFFFVAANLLAMGAWWAAKALGWT